MKDKQAVDQDDAALVTREEALAGQISVVAESLREAERREQDATAQFTSRYPVPQFLVEARAENPRLGIAVTGRCCAGKSSLLNRLLGHADDHPDAATVGEMETTMNGRPFPFRASRLWDLPGSSTDNFRSDTYIREMGLPYFDGLVLVITTRVREMDHKLLNEARRWGKPWFLVWTKADLDITNNKAVNKTAPEDTLAEIRTDIVREIMNAQELDALPEEIQRRIFVVSSSPGIWGQLLDPRLEELKAEIEALCT